MRFVSYLFLPKSLSVRFWLLKCRCTDITPTLQANNPYKQCPIQENLLDALPPRTYNT